MDPTLAKISTALFGDRTSSDIIIQVNGTDFHLSSPVIKHICPSLFDFCVGKGFDAETQRKKTTEVGNQGIWLVPKYLIVITDPNIKADFVEAIFRSIHTKAEIDVKGINVSDLESYIYIFDLFGMNKFVNLLSSRIPSEKIDLIINDPSHLLYPIRHSLMQNVRWTPEKFDAYLLNLEPSALVQILTSDSFLFPYGEDKLVELVGKYLKARSVGTEEKSLILLALRPALMSNECVSKALFELVEDKALYADLARTKLTGQNVYRRGTYSKFGFGRPESVHKGYRLMTVEDYKANVQDIRQSYLDNEGFLALEDIKSSNAGRLSLWVGSKTQTCYMSLEGKDVVLRLCNKINTMRNKFYKFKIISCMSNDSFTSIKEDPSSMSYRSLGGTYSDNVALFIAC